MEVLEKLNMRQFAQFLQEAQIKTFAGGQENPQEDGSTISSYSNGLYSLTDTWSGSARFAGQQVARYSRTKTPIWSCVYYGRDLNPEVMKNGGNDFLKYALRQTPIEFPVRGPVEVKNQDFIYLNSWYGDLTNFSGLDEIFFGIKLIFQLNYMGGLVQK